MFFAMIWYDIFCDDIRENLSGHFQKSPSKLQLQGFWKTLSFKVATYNIFSIRQMSPSELCWGGRGRASGERTGGKYSSRWSHRSKTASSGLHTKPEILKKWFEKPFKNYLSQFLIIKLHLHFGCPPSACLAPRSDSTLWEAVEDLDEGRGHVGLAPWWWLKPDLNVAFQTMFLTDQADVLNPADSLDSCRLGKNQRLESGMLCNSEWHQFSHVDYLFGRWDNLLKSQLSLKLQNHQFSHVDYLFGGCGNLLKSQRWL